MSNEVLKPKNPDAYLIFLSSILGVFLFFMGVILGSNSTKVKYADIEPTTPITVDGEVYQCMVNDETDS